VPPPRDRSYWEGRGVEYDDRTDADEPVAWNGPVRVPWPKTPDELDCRWVPAWEAGGRGWLSVRDPVTGERVVVPTKYVEGAPWRDVEGGQGIPAPQSWVRRAMEKLPPRPKRGAR
jgi:RimJ/RimL family protein N-acetyltransferase